MKLSEFRALCEREWNKPRRGDIESLCLTEDSHRELDRDVIIEGYSPGHLVLIDKAELAAIRAGAPRSSIVNPITRTVVKIRTKNSGLRDTARVRGMGGTYRQTWWPTRR